MNELLKCLEQCEEQNGLPCCKNCGLDKEMIANFRMEIINEIKDRVHSMPLCKSGWDEFLTEEEGGGFIPGQAHFKEHVIELLDDVSLT